MLCDNYKCRLYALKGDVPMKRKSVYIGLIMLLAFLISLMGCHGKVPGESTQPTIATAATTEPTVAATNPPETAQPETTQPETTQPETTPPETVPPETVPQETTEPPREYVPQDPDTTEYPSRSIQATMTFFAGMLYVNDNRADALVQELPDGYVYVGVTGDSGKADSIPRHALVSCHIPVLTEFYGSLQEPDYIYYQLDGKYRRMIRAGLVENYWDDSEIDPDVPENYTQLFFKSLLTGTFGENRYHCATYSEFDTPEDVDLNYLFYNGFYEERQKKLTEAEEKYLISDGWNKAPIGPVSNAKRLPVWLLDADLQRFFGISFYDANGVGVDQWQSYWSETGSYYVWRSDSIGIQLKVDEVVYEEDSGIYTVTYTMEYGQGTKVMRLRLVGDTFRVLSNKVK